MKSARSLKRVLAFVLCALLLMGDNAMLYAADASKTEAVETVLEEESTPVEETAEPTTEVQEEVVSEADAEAETTEEEQASADASTGDTSIEEEAVEQIEEEEEPKGLAAATYQATVEDSTVTVDAPEGAFTEAVTLQVSKVEVTEELQSEIDEKAIEEQKAIKSVTAYDIKFVNAKGEEVEPAKEVQVSIATPEISGGDDAAVYHFDEANTQVADMDATVDNAGDVAFDTNHFSTYVIVNQGAATVQVTIHHDTYENNNYREIYKTDVRNLPVGSCITDYAKATNWNVEGVFQKDANGAFQETKAQDLETFRITKDFEIWVRYTPKTQTIQGDAIFWDYLVKPQTTLYQTYKYKVETRGWFGIWRDNGTVYRPNQYYGGEHDDYRYTLQGSVIESADENEIRNLAGEGNYSNYVCQDDNKNYKYSINYIENFKAQNGYNPNRGYLTSGKTDQNFNSNRHDTTYNGQKINDYTEGQGSNAYKRGIIKGLDANGNVVFNVNDPGLFNVASSVGKTVYNNKEYYLEFQQVGDTYTLSSVKNADGNTVARAGADFFPMDSAPSNTQDAANNGSNNGGGTHNDFFGLRYDIAFTLDDYIGDLNYSFSGDDDLWVLIDGKPISELDMGGIHQALTGTADLWNYIDGGKNGCDRSKEHTLTILYMERGATDSNCQMNFTVPNAHIVEYTTPKADVTLVKKDADEGTLLSGATFKLVKDGNENEMRTVTSDQQGQIILNGLTAGTYTLTETIAPEGYELATTPWTIRVTVDNDNQAKAELYDGDGFLCSDYVLQNAKISVPVIPTYEKSKTVQVVNYNDRTYEIALTANSTTQTTSTSTKQEPVDVMLLLDQSGSMKYPMAGDVRYVGAGTYGNLKGDWGSLDNTYYVKSGNSYYELYDVALIGFEYKYRAANGRERSINDSTYLYRRISRLDILRSSVEQFLTSMSAKSPKSKVGIVAFSSEGYGEANNLYSLQQIGNNPTGAIASLDKLNANGGTSPELAMNEAQRQLNAANDGRKKIVILFTDGEPTGNHDNPQEGNMRHWDSKDASESAAVALKQSGATIYTVGFSLTDAAKGWLSGTIASDSAYAFTTDTQEGLVKIFEAISQSITKNYDIDGVTITDVIDARFELTPAAKDALKGLYVENADGTTTITWENVTLPYEGNWSKKIGIQAKADFLGGNKVPTNGSESGIRLTADGALDPFEQPTVNVKLLNFVGEDDEVTLFLGDEIASETYLQQLVDSMKVNGTPIVENATFTEGNSFTVDYAYTNTNDVLGTIIFRRTMEGEGASATNHTAEYMGSPAERYRVTAEYKPYTVAERPSAYATPASNAGREVTTSAHASATYLVHVVGGTLVIEKKISKSDYKKAYGDPVFSFQITNTTTGKVYYKTLRFGEAEEGIFNETIATTIEGLPKGNYEVREWDTMGFTFVSLDATAENQVATSNQDTKTASFVLELNKSWAKTTYKNKLTHSNRDTDTDVVKNTFEIGGSTSSHSDVDNGYTDQVGKTTTLRNN